MSRSNPATKAGKHTDIRQGKTGRDGTIAAAGEGRRQGKQPGYCAAYGTTNRGEALPDNWAVGFEAAFSSARLDIVI